ncbi:hypothetical protein [Myxococcus sp. Y35]|uniref:hypothetical protein n=1 Tax=Pseudomyxococcus flavus TaxID=3115648 RepID=UPI003CF2C8B2
MLLTKHKPKADVRRCAKAGCGVLLWPVPTPRATRFHDLRHTTATLLLKARVPLAVHCPKGAGECIERLMSHTRSPGSGPQPALESPI